MNTHQVYLKVIEARNLKGVESDGTSDPFVQIHIGGKNRELETKVCKKTLTPQWHQEFLVGIENLSQKIELKIYDWNRVSSNKSLGSYVLDPSKVSVNTFCDEWVQVDKQGELRISYYIMPADLDTPKKFNVKVDPIRVVLEKLEFWPGDIVRGVLVWNVSKPTKVHHLRLVFEASTSASYCKGNQESEYYVAETVIAHTSALLLGSTVEGKKEEIVVAPGEYLYPFEYCLPINLPQTDYTGGSNAVRIGIGAFADVVGKSNQSCLVNFHVRWHPNQVRPESQLFCEDPITKERDVKADITCPATAFINESFGPVSVTIENKSKKAITHFVLDLESRQFLCARSNWGNYSRDVGEWAIRQSWSYSAAVDVGATYGIKVPISSIPNVDTSLHSSRSPLLQNAYRFNIRVFTSPDSTLKCYGNTTAPVLVGCRYHSSFIGNAPTKPASEHVGLFHLAPAPRDCAFWVIPGRGANDVAWHCVRTMTSIPSLPGNYVPPNQISESSKVFLSTEESTARTDPKDWSLGSIPQWMMIRGVKGREGVTPANETILAAYYQ